MPHGHDDRYARRYDEHQLPQLGIEKKIMGVLRSEGECAPREVIRILSRAGFSESTIREHIWFLIDRGYIELTWDRKLKSRTQPLNPAPVDLL